MHSEVEDYKYRLTTFVHVLCILTVQAEKFNIGYHQLSMCYAYFKQQLSLFYEHLKPHAVITFFISKW